MTQKTNLVTKSLHIKRNIMQLYKIPIRKQNKGFATVNIVFLYNLVCIILILKIGNCLKYQPLDHCNESLKKCYHTLLGFLAQRK